MTKPRTATPPRPRTRKRRPERQGQIRRAALDLFRERGFHATSMADIGKRLGLSGPALYRHFANKEQILRSAIEDQLGQTTEETGRILAAARSPIDALERLVTASVRRVLDDPGLAIAAIRDQPLLSRETRRLLARVERRVLEDWVRVVGQVRTDLDDREVRTIVRGVTGLILWMAQEDGELPRAALASLVGRMALGVVLDGRALAER